MENAASPHRKALRLQRKIFNSLKSEANLLLGETPKSIEKYEKENSLDFRISEKQLRATSKAELLEAVRNVDVTFIADFHTFDQAQRTALRIIRETVKDDEEWAIGLEMISSEFQSTLDALQNNQISLDEFHKAISYQELWGFPWKNYAPLFEWAKENHVRLIALNRPQNIFLPSEEGELQKRDQWAAGIITDFFHSRIEKGHRPKMIVLYGELHVGTKHLPHQLVLVSRSILKTPLHWLTIHQNEARLYWKLAQKDKELHTEVVRLKKNTYCVFSSTPWAKLQSLINWIEGETPDTMDSEVDHLSMIRTYGNTISEFLSESPPDYESISTFTIDEAQRIQGLTTKDGLTPNDLRFIRFHVTHNQRLYIPKLDFAYLGSPTQNGAAELAAIHLLKSKTNPKQIFNYEFDDFFRLVLESSFGFFGSLILNHRRKCDLFEDHMRKLEELKNSRKGAFPLEREARLITVHLLKNRPIEEFDLKTAVTQKDMTPAVIMGAKFLGRIFGKRLHQAILSDALNLDFIRELFLKHPKGSSTSFIDRYKELFEATSTIVSANSKLESF